MDVNVTSMQAEQNTLKIMGEVSGVDLHECVVVIRKLEDEHVKEYVREFTHNINFDNNHFVFTADISSLIPVTELEGKGTWHLFIKADERYSPLKLNDNDTFVSEYKVNEKNPLFKSKLFVTNSNLIGLSIETIKINVNLAHAMYNQGLFKTVIEIDGIDLSTSAIIQDDGLKVVLKKREQRGLMEYFEEKECPLICNQGNYIGEVNMDNLFNKYILDKEHIWDFFIKITSIYGNGIEIPLINKSKKFNFAYYSLKNNDLFKVKPYITKLNQVALFLRPIETSVKISKLNFENNTIGLKAYLQLVDKTDSSFSKTDLYFVLKKRQIIGNEFEYYIEKKIQILSHKGFSFSLELNLSELMNDGITKQDDVWDTFIEIVTTDGRKLDIPLVFEKKISTFEAEYEELESNKTLKIKPYVTKNGGLSIINRKNTKFASQYATSVSVFGSCFSRSPFESRNYFNPGYKQAYRCDYTLVQSSIISLMSKPVWIDRGILSKTNLKTAEKKFLLCDLEKTFFDQLKMSNTEYFIIDLLVDAARDIIQISNESYVSASRILRRTPLYDEWRHKKRVIDHSDNNEYFNLWKKSFDQFAEKIVKIVPENRIVLSKGQFTDRFYDVNQNTVFFPKDRLRLIKRNNYFWNKLNNYFIYKLPKSRVIDLADKNFIGYFGHPYDNSPSHYESAYYKEYLNRLNRIVFYDLQATRF